MYVWRSQTDESGAGVRTAEMVVLHSVLADDAWSTDVFMRVQRLLRPGFRRDPFRVVRVNKKRQRCRSDNNNRVGVLQTETRASTGDRDTRFKRFFFLSFYCCRVASVRPVIVCRTTWACARTGAMHVGISPVTPDYWRILLRQGNHYGRYKHGTWLFWKNTDRNASFAHGL